MACYGDHVIIMHVRHHIANNIELYGYSYMASYKHLLPGLYLIDSDNLEILLIFNNHSTQSVISRYQCLCVLDWKS